MLRFAVLVSCVLLTGTLQAAGWQPKKAPLMTRWAKDVSPEKVHPEYPRPQMVREKWVNLNGLWDYAIVGDATAKPDKWDGKILVPFPVESALSGVMKRVPDNGKLWYRRSFATPEMAKDGRLLLHFGASDWETVVSVNGKKVGEHRGGYDPFTFDITDALKPAETNPKRERVESNPKRERGTAATDGENELIVAVSDPTDGSFQPRGKQIRKPHGIWYTPTTGIWQTVWLEPVPEIHIRSLKITTDVDLNQVRVTVDGPRKYGVAVDVTLLAMDGKSILGANGLPQKPISFSIPNAKHWTPDSPSLYGLTIRIARDNKVTDIVHSYFAMRKISLGKDEQGIQRLMLNNKPLFQYGPLDQGFWPDGLYTAPTDEALKYDIEMTKKLGFNMIRKHVKVESDRWYYHCDKLGMLVWQDMPSGDRYISPTDPDIKRSAESIANFENEWREIITDFGNHPSIVMWVPFNEGWGQFDTARMVDFTKKLDPTRLVNNASGWTDRGVGDVFDVHIYPGPGMAPLSSTRASVLGEFGGLGLPLDGHTWQGKDNWGYRSFTNKADLQKAYLGIIGGLRPLIGKGLTSAVYTQTTDVEIEVNGLMTYDREVLKFDAETLAKAHRKLYLPPPKITTIVPTSEETAQTWRYSTDKPKDGWEKSGFDDSAWKSGPGGFGEPSTPASVVKTNWKTADIWLRRDFEWSGEKPIHELGLRIHHDEDTEVFLNGVLIGTASGYSTSYQDRVLDESATKTLKPGKNVLAVHCHQTGGGQYIDVGLVDVQETEK
ncbi:MAG: glycoside hydrolase family 2 protein [Planctomycetaceae bacterium]